MNEVVLIDEIANQLGIAADQVVGHITELWPIYVSGMQAKSVVALGSIVVLCLVSPAIVALVTAIVKKKTKTNSECVNTILAGCLIWFGVGIIPMIIVCALCAPYLLNPEGAALVNVINTLKG